MGDYIFSDNIYYHYHIRCDVLSSKRKSYLDGNTTRSYNVPIYEESHTFVDFKKFKSKKQALEYCQKLIEQGFLEKKVSYHIDRYPNSYPKRLIKNKNLRIEKWKRYKFNPNNEIIPSTKEEKVKDFLVRDDRDGITQSVGDHNDKKERII